MSAPSATCYETICDFTGEKVKGTINNSVVSDLYL